MTKMQIDSVAYDWDQVYSIETPTGWENRIDWAGKTYRLNLTWHEVGAIDYTNLMKGKIL
jgi:hypothetical protein